MPQQYILLPSYLCCMNLDYVHLLPEDFAANSRVWVYQSERLFRISEALDMEDLLKEFVEGWTSHGAGVKGFATLLFGQFVVLMADESVAGVSGCSTDSSVRFVKDLGERFRTDFFNRTNLAFFLKDKIEVLPMNQLPYALDNGFITGDTLYFNNLVQTKKDLEEKWIIPVKDSWLAGRLPLRAS
jgi:hypothetical protein